MRYYCVFFVMWFDWLWELRIGFRAVECNQSVKNEYLISLADYYLFIVFLLLIFRHSRLMLAKMFRCKWHGEKKRYRMQNKIRSICVLRLLLNRSLYRRWRQNTNKKKTINNISINEIDWWVKWKRGRSRTHTHTHRNTCWTDFRQITKQNDYSEIKLQEVK